VKAGAAQTDLTDAEYVAGKLVPIAVGHRRAAKLDQAPLAQFSENERRQPRPGFDRGREESTGDFA
jgi:hypothetical protein